MSQYVIRCNNWNDLAATLPQFVKVERIHNGFWELDDDLVACSDDFARDVDESPANCIGVAGHWNHVVEDVLLEGLEQEEGEKHGVVERLVLCEPFEWKRFEAEVFEGAVRELFGSPLMVSFDNPLWFE